MKHLSLPVNIIKANDNCLVPLRLVATGYETHWWESMADYFITRRAALDLQDIYGHSVEKWGERVADEYLETVYGVFELVAKNPELGKLRRKRSGPFLMYPARKHFVIYDTLPEGIIILTLLHQMRKIESIIENLGPSFISEITFLKKQFHK
ncbi:MAG: type II toxin-antitoxin system RelE/ParE family toxin [Nitrospinae bacterium]|nr:type II toxin-antitoxin system RelE/ParE family toxin [Nitrospinota bacterium]